MSRKSVAKTMHTRQISLDELRKKQSVRATFKLPREAIELLGIIAGQLGIKQKSLLDKLVEDPTLLDRLAREAAMMPEDSTPRRQKTFVLSRSSLRSINAHAKSQQISRDLLVELSIKRLLPIIETELEKHTRRKSIVKEMKEYLQRGENLREKTRRLLGEDDILCDLLEKQVALAQKDIQMVDAIIEKGMPMEDW